MEICGLIFMNEKRPIYNVRNWVKLSNKEITQTKKNPKWNKWYSNPWPYVCKISSLPIVIYYLFEIKSQSKVHEDEQVFVI